MDIVSILTTVPKWLIGQASVRRREMKIGKREADVQIREKRVERIESLIAEQQGQLEAFIHGRLSRLFIPLGNETELGIDVEWFNSTLFPVEIKSARGVVILNGASLGHQMSLASVVRCLPCRSCSCTLYLHIGTDRNKQLMAYKDKGEAQRWQMNITWDMIVALEKENITISPQDPRAEIIFTVT